MTARRWEQRLARCLPHAWAGPCGALVGRLRYLVGSEERRSVRDELTRSGEDASDRLVLGALRERGYQGWSAASASRFDDVAFCRRLRLEGWEHLHDDVVTVVVGGAPEVARRALTLYRPEILVVSPDSPDSGASRRVRVEGWAERAGRFTVRCGRPLAS